MNLKNTTLKAATAALLSVFAVAAMQLRAADVPRRDVPWVSLKHQRELEAKALKAASGDAESIKKDSGKKKSALSKLMEDAKPQLSADKFKYKTDASGALIATGDAKIADKRFELLADTIEFSQKDEYAKAHGNVRAAADMMRMASTDLSLNFGSDKLETGYARFGVNPVYAETDSIKGDKKLVELGKSRVYFGEPGFASMNANTSAIRYNTETELLEMENTTMQIGAVPFFYTPYYSQHGLQKPPFNLKTRVGMNDDYGVFIANDFFYNGLEDFSPGLLLDYYTKRSVLVGPAVEYDHSGVETWLKGWAQGAYINDNANADILGYDSLGNKIERERFFIEFRHNQFINDNIGIVSNVSWWSDEFVTRDFRPELFYDNQTPDNFAEATYYDSFFTASVFTRFAPNDWEFVQQRLPEVRLDMQPMELFETGIYQNFYASYAYLRQFDPYKFVAPDARYLYSNRVNAYYGIERPIQLNSWSKITPVLGGMVTYYANALNGDQNYTRFLGQIGFDAQMDVWGSWEFKSQTMNIDGIRHHMIPMVSYRYIPAAGQGNLRAPQIDTYYYTTYPPILDLGSMRNIDELYKTNTMRFGLQNIFETRDEEYGSREIARLDIFQDFNFDKAPLAQADGLQSWSDLYLNASVSPARWLTIGTYSRFNIEHGQIPEVNTYLGLFDGDAASIYFITSYLMGSINQYSVFADYRISERFKVYGQWNYDSYLNMFTNQTYGLWTRMSNTWIIEYLISYRQGSTRQNDFTFGVRASLLIF